MKSGNSTKIFIAALLFAGAGFGFYRFFNKKADVSEENFFYDLSEKKLFAASRDSLPPIRGLNNDEEDAVRAIVVCASGDPDNPANRTIAYLEKYAPELKRNIEEARQGKTEPMKTKLRNSFRLVSRSEENKWHPADSPQGQNIMTNWNVAGPDGKYPIVCSP
jgi:hypothetical protein